MAKRARGDRRGARRQVCHEPEARRRKEAASRRALPRARQGPGRDDGGPWLPQEPREAQRVGRRARAGTAKAPRSEAQEGGDFPRGEGAGRRRARGEGRVRRGDSRATRRAGNGTLPLAQGDDGRQWRGTREEGRARGQGVRRPARRRRGVAGHAARGEDAAREGAAGAGRSPGDPRDSKKRPGRRPGAAGRRGEGGDGYGAGGQV